MNQEMATERFEETQNRFRTEALPTLELQLSLSDQVFDWITGEQLLKITDVCMWEFLKKTKDDGYWQPDLYAQEVFDNFVDKVGFYFDKKERLKSC